MSVPLAFLSLLVERVIGYPEPLLKAIGHPVIWIGKLVSLLDNRLNRADLPPEERRQKGTTALVVLIVVSGLVAAVIVGLLSLLPFGVVFIALVATSLLAQQSLGEHVADVANALDNGGIVFGRIAVARIVGRDPDKLDHAGVSRAAIESLAENFSDGVVAPAFWLGVGGLVGATVYKAVNTADSMIGHHSEKYEEFGRATARFDDLVNLPASRLSGLLIVCAAFLVAGASHRNAWLVMRRDAKKHRSPNAGWPEAAMAGALGLALAGPRVYGGITVDDATMGEGGRREATSADIRTALKLYRIADLLLIGLFGILAVLLLG